MTKTQSIEPSPVWTGEQRAAWRRGLSAGIVLLSALGWILARVVWLWAYFGLFFFLIAGLLVGAVSFRVARSARPMSRPAILWGVALIAGVAWTVTVVWEYRFISATIARPEQFTDARNAQARKAAIARKTRGPAGEQSSDRRTVDSIVAEHFRAKLHDDYWPGGLIGYVAWATGSGRMELVIDGVSERVSITQRGLAWPVRSLVAIILLAAGLWSNLESLRSPSAVSNFLVPGEEAEDEST